MMRKGEQGPAIDLLTSFPTNERNGTEIKIYIKNESDLLRFLTESAYQLEYFSNVVFDVHDISSIYNVGYTQMSQLIRTHCGILTKDYQILEGTHFLYKTGISNRKFELHIALGNVTYPIDWNNLGISRISIPVALKFKIGELPVIQTREDIRYTDAAIEAIKAKIELLKGEFVEIYNKSFEQVDTFEEFTKMSFHPTATKITLLEDEIMIGEFVDLSLLNPTQIKDFPIQFKSRALNYVFQKAMVSEFDFNSKGNPGYSAIFGDAKLLKGFTSNWAVTSNLKYGTAKQRLQVTQWGNNTYYSLLSILKSLSVLDSFNILFTKNFVNSVKKNKYLFSELNWNPEKTYVVQLDNFEVLKGKIPVKSMLFLYKHFKNATSDKNLIISFRDFIKVLDYLFKPVLKELNESKTMLNYDTLQVPDTWWNKYRKENYSATTVDRTLNVIEKFKNTSKEWDRKSNKYTVLDVVKNGCYLTKGHINILLDKDQQERYCSKNNDYTNTYLEKIAMYTQYFKFPTTVQLLATSKTTYNKILNARGEHSTIYTLEEFLNDKKMQKSILGKIATMLRINQAIDLFDTNQQGKTFRQLNNVMWIMNEQLYQDYLDVVRLCTEPQGFGKLTKENLETLMSEFDTINLHVDIYDYDLLDKANKVFNFIKQSRIDYVESTPTSMNVFVKNYKPDCSYHFLHKELMKPVDKYDYKYIFTDILKKTPLAGDVEYKHYVRQQMYSSFSHIKLYNQNINALDRSKYENTWPAMATLMYFKLDNAEFNLALDKTSLTLNIKKTTDTEETVEETVTV